MGIGRKRIKKPSEQLTKSWDTHIREQGYEPGDFDKEGKLKVWKDAKGKKSTKKENKGSGKTMKKVPPNKIGVGVPFGDYRGKKKGGK